MFARGAAVFMVTPRSGDGRSPHLVPMWLKADTIESPGPSRRVRGVGSTLCGVDDVRNPHVGEPFADDDATIAIMLEDVSVPVLLCSLVHMTGDPSWIRERSL